MGSSPSKDKSSKASATAVGKGELSKDCGKTAPIEDVCSKVGDIEPVCPSKDQDQIQEIPEPTETKIEEAKELNTPIPDHTDEVKRPERRQKNKKKQRGADKLRKSSITKVDFPPHMIRAHQAAYGFLNPNISKFESLLGLLDQVAHTQISLRPMMSALILRFEEINQALDEMAEEGELMMKEHGDYMGIPSGMMGPKINGDKANPAVDPPPDLLQQLLQHSTEKMRLVGGSFQEVGDNTLEEAVEYFASLSKVLVEKMKAKHSAEERIVQVLAQVEAAAMRKCNPEDSALHSEDSGIGGENDSLGSDRQRRHRGSAESGGSSGSSGANVRAVLQNNCPNAEDSNECNEEEEEEEEDIDEEDDIPERKRSNSSPPDPSQMLVYMQQKVIQLQRPHTAAVASKPEALLLLQNMKNSLEMRGHNEVPTHQPRLFCKTNVCTLSTSAAQTPRPPSVKRLANSFTRPSQKIRKTGVSLSNTQSTEGAVHNTQQWPDNKEDQEEENLPPPPPEVLMDNSFQRSENIPGNEKTCQETEGLPPTNQKRGLSQRLKMVELLPNRASIKPRSLNVSTVPPVRQDAIVTLQEEEQQESVDTESSLYEQAKKIIHIRSAAGPRGPAPQRSNSSDICEGDMSCSLPVIAPPVSRVRLPSTCPSVRHRIPSPPMGRPQSGSSRPSSPKSITKATESQVEEIVPSVSFHDARSVFCRNDLPNPQAWTSSGASVLPRAWGETSRGRPGTRAVDPVRRTQSEQRPTITIRTGAPKSEHPLTARR